MICKCEKSTDHTLGYHKEIIKHLIQIEKNMSSQLLVLKVFKITNIKAISNFY